MSERTASFKETWIYRRGRLWVVCLFVLLVAGFALLPLERKVWPVVRSSQPEMNLGELEGALGQGVVIGVLGGFRTLLADIVFLRANYYWEKKDRPATEAWLNLATAIDPRSMFFWQNGARMIAYDIPVWRIKEAGGFSKLPEEEQQQIFAEQARRAIGMMERAGRYYPADYRVPLEIGQIYSQKLKDDEKGAEYYLKASELPNAPHYIARIHAELLRRSGKLRESYDFLLGLFEQLRDDTSPQASVPVLLERIRELEEQLEIPAGERLPEQPMEQAAKAEPQA